MTITNISDVERELRAEIARLTAALAEQPAPEDSSVVQPTEYKDAIEVSVIFHEGRRMFAVPKQPAPEREDWGPGPHECHSLPEQQEPEIVQRVKRYAGKTMRTARGPNITARECIALADWIAANTSPGIKEQS